MRIAFCFSLCWLFIASIGFAQNKTGVKELTPVVSTEFYASDKQVQQHKKDMKLYNTIDSVYRRDGEAAVKKQFTKAQQAVYTKYINNEELTQNPLSTEPWGCSWYCGYGPDSIYASSELAPVGAITYKADNIHDFWLNTAWVPDNRREAVGEWITFRYTLPDYYIISSITIHNGYQKSDLAYKNNARVKRLKLYVNNKPYAVLDLIDSRFAQRFELGELKGSSLLKFEIMDVYPGDKYNDVAISEINFSGTGPHCFITGSKVLVDENKWVLIEELKEGDRVLTYNQETKQPEHAIVEVMVSASHNNLYEYKFAGGYAVIGTDDHPFYRSNGTFAALKPKSIYAVKAGQLKVGDKVKIMTELGLMNLELLETIKRNICQQTYTITKLSKNNIFFVNNIAVATEELK